MTTVEREIPDWAVLDREREQAWIRQNLDVFWHSATQGSQCAGRGAIFVDVAARPMGNRNLFTYFTADEVERYENEAIDRLVAEYNPDEEFIIVLLKPKQKVSSYRIRPLLPDNNHESH
jgi:hypothetical protein